MKKMLKIHPVYLVGISLLIAFCLHLGCQEDITSAPIPDDPDEILMHWAATQDQTWSILLMEKVAKYEAENYRALAYARDLEILIFAKFYYQTKLAEIYGDNCVDDTIFLKQKWEGLVTKVVNKEIPLLDYNKEWNSYRLLFYTTPPEKRGHINTRSDDFTIWGCNFASIIYKGLYQLNLTKFDENKIANGIFKATLIDEIFTPAYTEACRDKYYRAVRNVQDMKQNNGSNFNQAHCYYLQMCLESDIKELVACLKDTKTTLYDNPLPPGHYSPSIVVDGTTNIADYDVVRKDCSGTSQQNGHYSTVRYNDILKETNVKEKIFELWKTYPSREIGTFIVVENNKLKIKGLEIGTENSCPLKNKNNYVAAFHTHPKGLGPSWKDVIHLCEQIGKFNGSLRDSYVLTQEHEFGLHVADKEKVKKFYDTYYSEEGQQTFVKKLSENVNLLNKQRIEVHGEYHEIDFQLYALIATLNEVDAGMYITKSENGTFHHLNTQDTTITKDNQQVKRIIKTICQ